MQLKQLPKKLTGFSLLEILLYLSIMSIVVTVSSALFNVLIEGRLRNQVLVEINQQGNSVVDTFATTLRNSQSITNITADSITFEVYDAELNPVVLDETDGEITISYAGGEATPLHSDDVIISNLTFTDVSNALTTGSVRISFDMGYNSTSQRAAFQTVETFSTTATLRRPSSSGEGGGGFNLANWSANKTITIDNTLVSGSTDHLNFPFYFYQASDAELAADALASGDDIIFTSNTGSLLDFEIEVFDESTGEIAAWIEIPVLDVDADTAIEMYYNNPAAENLENLAGIWGSEYVMVQHMNQDPSGAAPQLLDATANDNDGTSVGTMASGDLVSGIAGHAIDFDGVDDYFTVTDDPFDFTDSFTISTWNYYNQNTSHNMIMGNLNYGGNTGWQLRTDRTSDSNGWRLFYGTTGYTATGGSMATGQWIYVTVTYDNEADQVRFYKNGMANGSASSVTNPPTANTNVLELGKEPGNNSFEMNGLIDETRVSTERRNSDWFLTEYNNISDPSLFYDVSSGSGLENWYSEDWQYRKSLTISSSMVAGSNDFSDFPVLIEISSDTDLSTNALANGHDILFTAADGTTKLSHEIEEYNSGDLLAWVEIPTLSASTDTEIFIYFGNSGASNQQDIENTWSNDFLMVHKMNTDPGGSAPQLIDSTVNNYDGTSSGSMDSSDLVAGNIGDGIQFDGTDDLFNTATNYGLTATSEVTITTWVYLDTASKKGAFFKLGWNNGYGFGVGGSTLGNNGNDLIAIYEYVRWIDTNTTIGTGNHMVTMQVNSSGVPSFYIDGSSIGSFAGSNAANPSAVSSIGGYPLTGARYSSARIDHLTLSSGLRTADWIATEFNSQSDPATYLTLGSLEGN